MTKGLPASFLDILGDIILGSSPLSLCVCDLVKLPEDVVSGGNEIRAMEDA